LVPAASRNPFRLLGRARNFRLFWVGQTLSLVGTWMQSMSQGWLALELSNSALLVGLVATASSLPVLVLSLHAGVLVDRRDKMRLLRLAQTLLLGEATLIWWFVWSGHITIWGLLALALIGGTASAVEIPARQSLMVELVGRDDLHDAIALNSGGFNIARIVGPAVAAIVIARLGIAWCFALNALSYIAVIGGLAMVRMPAWTPVVTRASPLEGIRELFAYMRGTREVSALMQLVTVFSVFGVPYLTLMPVVARDRLGTGAGGYGVLLSCVGLGGLAGALYLASAGGTVRRGALLVRSGLSYGLLLLLFSLVRSVRAAELILLATGFVMILNGALANGLLQLFVPDSMRGRLMSAYSLIVVGVAQVVGSLLAGAVAKWAGVGWAIGGGATVIVLFTIWAIRTYPELAEL
jgi:MFS family permease